MNIVKEFRQHLQTWNFCLVNIGQKYDEMMHNANGCINQPINHYGSKVVFACWHVTSSLCHHCTYLFEATEHKMCVWYILTRVCRRINHSSRYLLLKIQIFKWFWDFPYPLKTFPSRSDDCPSPFSKTPCLATASSQHKYHDMCYQRLNKSNIISTQYIYNHYHLGRVCMLAHDIIPFSSLYWVVWSYWKYNICVSSILPNVCLRLNRLVGARDKTRAC